MDVMKPSSVPRRTKSNDNAISILTWVLRTVKFDGWAGCFASAVTIVSTRATRQPFRRLRRAQSIDQLRDRVRKRRPALGSQETQCWRPSLLHQMQRLPPAFRREESRLLKRRSKLR